jgi:hypothetical protein
MFQLRFIILELFIVFQGILKVDVVDAVTCCFCILRLPNVPNVNLMVQNPESKAVPKRPKFRPCSRNYLVVDYHVRILPIQPTT